MKRLLAIALLFVLVFTGCSVPAEVPEATPPSATSYLSVHFIDVDQADGMLLIAGETTVLIDAGNLATNVKMVKYLQRFGVQELDLVVNTHPHMDHMGGYPIFADLFADKVTLEQVVFNLPNEEITEEFTDGFIAKGDGKEITGEYVELLESVTTDYFPAARLVEAHPGQVYYIRDAVINMLYTWEMDWNMPNRCNSLSLVFTVEIGDTKVMVPGDSGESSTKLIQNVYKENLKSDFLITIHHGGTGGTATFNRYVDPDIVLWPSPVSHYNNVCNSDRNKPLQDADAIYVVGDRVLAVTLPYKGEESVTWRDAIEPILNK
jgi:competence protein ComEC